MIKRSKPKLKNLNKYLIVAVIVAVIAFAIYYFSGIAERKLEPMGEMAGEGIVTKTKASNETVADADKVYINGDWYRIKSGIKSTLLIGVDDFGVFRDNDAYVNHSQADFLLLTCKNEDTGETFAIQINRDTITSVQILSVGGTPAGREDQQIALAHTYGTGGEDSCENTVDAAKYFLYNVPIDNYIAMTMDGVAIMNDLVGGVTVKALQTIPSIGAVEGEVITLKNDEALTYVRARKELEDSSNTRRQERQRQYILAWCDIAKDKFKSASDAAKMIEKISPYLVTNCDAMTLSKMAQDLAEYKTAPIYVPEGEVVEGEEFMEFYADEGKLRSLILDLFYEKVEE